MTDLTTSSIRLTKPTIGGDSGSWGGLTNSDWDYVDIATNHAITVAIPDANVTLVADGSAGDQARYLMYSFTGALTADRTVTLPAVEKFGFLINSTTGGHNVIVSNGGTTATVPPDGHFYPFRSDTTPSVFLLPLGLGAISGTNGTFSGTLAVGGNSTLSGSLTVSGSQVVSGNTTTHGATLFGNTGAFIAEDNGANQLIQFAPNQYIQFVPGDGLYLNTTGTIHQLAGAVLVNGVAPCLNNGGTYSINVTGSSGSAGFASSAGAVAWGNVTGKPYAFNQSTDVGASVSFGSLSLSGGISESGSGGSIGSNTASGAAGMFAVTQAAATPNTTLYAANTGNTGSTLFAFQFNGGTVGSILTNGSAVAYNTTSDYRLKNTYGPSDGSVIDALHIYDASWKTDDAERYPMLLAHEAAEVAPWAVNGEKDAVDENGAIVPQLVDYSKFIAALIAKCQSLVARCQSLEARVAVLEAK